ncbi:MAG: sulfotransferase family protein, partial [Rubrobacter sp.]
MRPYVFIVGCARSGTTLLQRIVDSHPKIAVTPSMHWMRDLFREHDVKKPDDLVSPDLVSDLIEHPRFARLRLDPERVGRLAATGVRPTHAGLLSAVFELYGEAAGKPLVGNKTAPFVRRIPELHGLWPEAKFVHLIRDGRDVCLSTLEWESAKAAAGRYTAWEVDPISTTALWWRRKVLLGREGGKPLGPGLYHETRYEALISDPVRECERLCRFLGVLYD